MTSVPRPVHFIHLAHWQSGCQTLDQISTLSSDLVAELTVPNVAIAFLRALLAGLSRGFSGFGGGSIYMPLAASVLCPKTAMALFFLIDLSIISGQIVLNA